MLSGIRLADEYLGHVAEFVRALHAAAPTNSTFVDLSEFLCPADEWVYRHGFVSPYIDGNHLGAEAVKLLKPQLMKALLNPDGNRSANALPSKTAAL